MHYFTNLIQRHRLIIATTAFIIGCILIAGILAFLLTKTDTAEAMQPIPDVSIPISEEEPIPNQDTEQQPTTLIVYVTGAVIAPDVYQVPANARLKDLVLAAGGFLPDADTQAINLAAPLSDAEHIHVPRIGENEAINTTNTNQPAESTGGSSTGALIDLNSASAADLDALPGVGPALAERIIAYRSENGPFANVEDLANVKGIGTALIEKIAPLVTIEP